MCTNWRCRRSILDVYKPATIASYDLRSGEGTDTEYAPDSSASASLPNPRPSDVVISGNYVYLTVQGTLYRYDLGRDPATAHPTRLAQGPTSTFWFTVTTHGA